MNRSIENAIGRATANIAINGLNFECRAFKLNSCERFYKIPEYSKTLALCHFWTSIHTVYPKKYAHGFVVLCFVVVMPSFIMNSREVFIHIHQGCFAGTGAIVRLSQCQWSKPDGYGKISQCITTTKHSKAKTVCIFLGIYCNNKNIVVRRPRLHSKFKPCWTNKISCVHVNICLNWFIFFICRWVHAQRWHEHWK